ncbi:MAG: 4-alpha-glucanotransferase [Verrucomicrobiota bacterium]
MISSISENPLAGILAPLFSLRGHHDLGIGDTGALRELIDWAADHHFHLIQLLPINATGNDPSPYNAISSVALDPSTLEISPLAIPDLSAAEIASLKAEHHFEQFAHGPVNYSRAANLKNALLSLAFTNFTSHIPDPDRTASFTAFCQNESTWLDDYSLFRTLFTENHHSERWDWWPAHHQSPTLARLWLDHLPTAHRDSLLHQIRFHQYLQWLADQQWLATKSHATAKGVSLMGDIPFGISHFSADVWAHRELFDHQWSGGTGPDYNLPDDPFASKWGQNWGIPLYKWDQHRQENFAWWRQRIRKVRSTFDFFRVDHILGFFRIYAFPWLPDRNDDFIPLSPNEASAITGGHLPHFVPFPDDSPAHQAANRDQGIEILSHLIDEAGPGRLVGEDLGDVPHYVRPALTQLGIAGFKIPDWEWHNHNLTPGSLYPRLSVATYGTHDLDSLRSKWEYWMEKITLALEGGPETYPARDQAWTDLRRLAAWAGFAVPCITPYYPSPHAHLFRALLETRSDLAIYSIIDLFAATDRFNLPGSKGDQNWTHRLPLPIAAWTSDPYLLDLSTRLRSIIIETGRASTS